MPGLDTDTFNPIPSANASFLSTLQTFLREEMAERYADTLRSYVVSGGTHATAASLTSAAFATVAYISGYRINQVPASITYTNAVTTWVIAHIDQSGNVGNFIRVGSTHYLTQVVATQPSLPTDAIWLMQVITSGGAITTVRDLRTTSSLPRIITPVTDYGVIPRAGIDNTVNFQAALDSASEAVTLYVPPGTYDVTTLIMRRNHTRMIFAGAATIRGIATVATTAVFQITRPFFQCYGGVFSGNLSTNYTTCIQWYAPTANDVPSHCTLFAPSINDSYIGILFGSVTNPLSAAVSENHIIGGTFRGVERNIYSNQPNGFLHISNMVLSCQQNELPTFNHVLASCLENHEGVLSLNQCNIIKNTAEAGQGWAIVNTHATALRSIITLNDCQTEISSRFLFAGGNSNTRIHGLYCNQWVSGLDNFIEVEDSTEPIFIEGDGIEYVRAAGAEGSTTGLLDTHTNPNVVARFTNCTLRNQLSIAALTSTEYNRWFTGDVRIKNSVVADLLAAVTMPLEMAEHNLAWYYHKPDVTRWAVNSSNGGNSFLPVPVGQAEFASAYRFICVAGAQIYADMNVNIDQSIRGQNRLMVLEATLQSEASTTQFFGLCNALYYNDGNVFLSSQDLTDGNGRIGHLASVGGLQAWRRIRKVLNVPRNCSEISIRFGCQTFAQTFYVGNIKVY